MTSFEVLHADMTAKGVKYSTTSSVLGVGGTVTLVAGVAGKRIRVLALHLATSSGGDVYEFYSAAAGTLIWQTQANSTVSLVVPMSSVGWFQTVAGELLQLKSVGGATVKVNVVYVEVG